MSNIIGLERKAIALCTFCLILMFVSYFPANYAHDSVNYLVMFEYASQSSFVELLENYNFANESLFNLILYFSSMLFDFKLTLFFITYLSLVLKMLIIAKIDNSITAIYLYCISFMVVFDSATVRIGLATTIALLGALYFFKKKYSWGVFFFLISSQIQATTIIFIPIVFFLIFFKQYKFINFAFLASPISLLFKINLVDYLIEISSKFNNKFINYYQNTDELASLDLNSILLITFFYSLILYTNIRFYHYKTGVPLQKIIQFNYLNAVCQFGVIAFFVFHYNLTIAQRISFLLIIPLIFNLSTVFRCNFKCNRNVENITISILLIVFSVFKFVGLFYFDTLDLDEENQFFKLVGFY